ncbi:MAG: MarR family transcriptional regulator, partial [Kordiimonas sp.]
MASNEKTKSPIVVDDINSFELEKWPFYLITRTSSTYMKTLEAELKGGDLDIPSWRVLMLLGGG